MTGEKRMTKRQMPKNGEHWHVQYGANVKTDIIVKVIGFSPKHGLINWNQDNFECDRLGEKIWILGSCFVERFSKAPKTRVFTSTVSPLGRDILKGKLK